MQKYLQSIRYPKYDPALLRQLSGMGNNLNQIARAINSQDWKPVDRVQIVAALSGLQRELNLIRTKKNER
ncbi:MobC family plasmid mobilization relaxosome protein [Enterovibrio norvegicus]|uniref:MobC family plasmid mobilization relaxosome protein n=1 Tax=Enterovibrio norvegicus TaxID=188144 RepID=UPI00389AD486